MIPSTAPEVKKCQNCPNCNNDNIMILETESGHGHYVTCFPDSRTNRSCGLHGPVGSSIAMALEMWNKLVAVEDMSHYPDDLLQTAEQAKNNAWLLWGDKLEAKNAECAILRHYIRQLAFELQQQEKRLAKKTHQG